MTHRYPDGYCHLHRKLAKTNSKPLNSVGAKSAMFETAARKCGCNSDIVPAGKVAARLAKIQRESKKDNMHVVNLGLGDNHVGHVSSKAQIFGHVSKDSSKRRPSVTALSENAGGLALRAAMFNRPSSVPVAEVRQGSGRKYASVGATWSNSIYSPRGSATTLEEIAVKNKDILREMIEEPEEMPKSVDVKLEPSRPRILSFTLSVDSHEIPVAA
jgi:hypothetical protein